MTILCMKEQVIWDKEGNIIDSIYQDVNRYFERCFFKKSDIIGADMKDNLKICRKNKRMTTKEVSEKIGVSKQAIYNIETGVSNPSVDTLMKLAELYNVSTDYLLGLTDFENFKSQYEHLQSLEGDELFAALDALHINKWMTEDCEEYSKLDDGWYVAIRNN